MAIVETVGCQGGTQNGALTVRRLDVLMARIPTPTRWPTMSEYEPVETFENDRVMLDGEEAMRIANTLEMAYEESKADAYSITDEQAARDAMMLRELAGVSRNPDLLDTDAESDGE